MPSLIFLIPVLSSTMVPVARTVVVILETFLLEEIDLFVLEEKTLLLPARDADKDMDKTEEAILMYQFYLRCCVLRVITMRKFFCARSKKKGEIDVTLVSQKGKKKVKIPEILFSFGPRGDLFFLSTRKEKDKKRRKQRREEKQILFLKRIRYISSQITTLIIIIIIIIIFSFSLSLSLLSIYYFS